MAASEGPGHLHMPEITVFTKTAAIDARSSSDVNGDLGH
jgi:hypothetical protein